MNCTCPYSAAKLHRSLDVCFTVIQEGEESKEKGGVGLVENRQALKIRTLASS